jgi:hypothetical protein
VLCQVRKGVHPVYAGLHVSFPLKDSRLLKRLRRCVSALAHWSPVVGELAFLPELAFPFVKLFGTLGGGGALQPLMRCEGWSALLFFLLPHMRTACRVALAPDLRRLWLQTPKPIFSFA